MELLLAVIVKGVTLNEEEELRGRTRDRQEITWVNGFLQMILVFSLRKIIG